MQNMNKAAESFASRDPGELRPRQGRGEKILIIEDDFYLQDGLQKWLHGEGYQAQSTALGKSGLALALRESPDLVILDLTLPDINGWEVTRQLRKHPATQSTPILIFSERSELADKAQAIEAGADEYLPKSRGSKYLLTHIKALLTRRRLQIVGNV
jgi:two-component system alkaline phosphatase synthesis response regulator PhoP